MLRSLIKKIFNHPPDFELDVDRGYLHSYAQFINERVKWNPKEAVGGMWDEIGQLQFDFLKSQGMHPNHQLLDIGCGTLRGGRFCIEYLNSGNYTGFDISSNAVEYSQIVVNQLFKEKGSLIFQSMEGLKSMELQGLKFDYILAQSVFTHIGPELIEEYIGQVRNYMTDQGKFFFTYDESDVPKIERAVDFLYPIEFFESLALKYGFQLSDCRNEYQHPRNQIMLCFTCLPGTF